MKYKLNIQKYIENPTFKDYNNSSMDYHSQFIPTTCLEVELTEEEYKKVKAEVYKVFE